MEEGLYFLTSDFLHDLRTSKREENLQVGIKILKTFLGTSKNLYPYKPL